MALPGLNLPVSQIINVLGVSSPYYIFYNSDDTLKTISEVKNIVSGILSSYCPGTTYDDKITNLLTDRRLSYFKGYYHGNWTLLNSLMSREAHAATVTSYGDLLVAGGFINNSSNPLNSTLISTDNGNTWNYSSNMPWGRRYYFPMVYRWTEGKVYLFGGSTITDANNNDIWKTGYGTNWTEVTSNAAWAARRLHSAICDSSGNLYIIGGRTKSTTTKSDIWKSTDGGNNWNQILNNNFPDREGHQSVIDSNDNIYIIGGQNSGGRLNDVQKYNTNTGDCTTINSSCPWTARSDFVALIDTNDNIFILGGNIGGNCLSDMWISMDGGSTWDEISTPYPPWSPRQRHAGLIRSNNEMFIIGGNTDEDVWGFI